MKKEFFRLINKWTILARQISWLIAFVVIAPHQLAAQTLPIRIVLTIAPPYPVSVSYYADHPEQVLVQVINLGREPQSFRLVGSINGLDNNVKVVAKDRGASDVITLNGGEARLLSTPEIQDLFDARKLVFSGIDFRKTQIDDGLPEGLYNVCAYAVDAVQTNMQRSDQACSNAFPVSNLEPPMIISPMPDVELQPMPVQNTLFTWTLPASAPPSTEYTIRMVEVIPGMNPNQAILSSTTPSFFERTVQGNTLLYGPADPTLIPGRRYAFVIAAKDPQRRAVFRNNGRSAVQTFVYAPATGSNSPANDFKPKPTLPIADAVVAKDIPALNATVQGRLVFAFPEDYTMTPFKSTSPIAGAKPWKENDQTTYLTSSNFESFGAARPQGKLFEKLFEGSALKAVANIQPVKNVKVSLIQVYAFKETKSNSLPSALTTYDAGDGWRVISAFNDYNNYLTLLVNDKDISNEPLSKVLATAVTTTDGNFSLTFIAKDTSGSKVMQTKTKSTTVENGTYYNQNTNAYEQQYKTEGGELSSPGIIHKVAILVVESPYFCSPLIRIYTRPGDNILLPEQVVLAKTFESRLYTINDVNMNQAGGGNFATLQGIQIELFRSKPIDILLPKEEGQNLPATAINSLKMGDFSNVYPISQVDRVVAISKTNGDGFVTIPKIFRGQSAKLIAHAYTSFTTGVYNKFDAVENISESGINSLPGADKLSPFLVFNGGYPYSRVVNSLEMVSKKPRIVGKVVELTKALPGVNVYLVPKAGKGWTYQAITTDKDGVFEFNNLEPWSYTLSFVKPGYVEKTFGQSDVKSGDTNSYFTDGPTVFALQMGQLLQTNEIQLKPKSKLQGIIQDEEGNQVVCDLQLADGAFYKTNGNGGTFEIPAQTGVNLSLKVYPRSDEYMEEIVKVSIDDKPGVIKNAGIIKVYRNRHRIQFTVLAKIANMKPPLADATVKIKGLTKYTDDKGKTLFEIESPGDKFLVSVKPPKNSGYAHWEEEITVPISKTPMDYEVVLRNGKSIAVTVLQLLNGIPKPAPNVKVYIKRLNVAWDDNAANYVEAITDDKGVCQLTGIPMDETSAEVFVSKEPDNQGSYTANSQTVNWVNITSNMSVQFILKTTSEFAVNRIWGYPVQIEKLMALGNNTYQASGSIVNLPGNSNFDVLDRKTRLDFKDVVFIKNPNPPSVNSNPSGQNPGPFNLNNVTMVNYESHIPKNDFLITLQNAVGIKIFKKLQGEVMGYGAEANNNPRLYIAKTPANKGIIRGNVSLDLVSFSGAYNLKGQIRLGSNANNPVVDVLNSDYYPKRKFFLGQGSASSGNNQFYFKNLPFTVHGFTAEAEREKSYVSNDSVNLFTVLHTAIPNMEPADLNIQAGYITVLPDHIIPFNGGNAIAFSLEKWKVIGQKANVFTDTWHYDNNNGGIVIPKVVVNTGMIGISLKNVIIKPDRLIADKMELDKSDASSLSLGGIVPLSILPETQVYFTYDPNCYHDNKPHWKFSLLNPKGRAAEIKNLDALEDGQILAFESMNIFSDNQQQLSGNTLDNLLFRKVLHFFPTTVDVGADYFTLVGAAAMDIPNFSNAGQKVPSQILYTKSNNGKAVFNFKPLYFNVEAAGKCAFQASDLASSQSLTSGKFTAEGSVKIYDDASKQSFTVKGRLLHQKNSKGFDTYIEIAENQKIQLGDKYLDIKPGIINSGMRVKGNQWETTYLKVTMPVGNQGFVLVKEEEAFRTLKLLVKGAIKTDPSSGMVGVKGMDTGMGSISLFYDFNSSELRGNFFFNPAVPLNVGPANITSGNVSMAIGSHGMFIMNNGTGELAVPGGIPLPVSTTLSSVTGYYTKSLPAPDIESLMQLSVQKTLPDFITTGLKGIYTSATATITPLDENFNPTKGIPKWVADVSAHAKASLSYELRNYVNFNSINDFELFSGLYAYGEVDIGGKATILGCGPSAGVKFNAQLSLLQSAHPTDLAFSYSGIKNTLGSLKLEGCGSVGVSLYLGACLPFPLDDECAGFDLEADVSLHIKASPPIDKKVSDALKIWFTLDDCGNGLPVKKLNESGY